MPWLSRAEQFAELSLCNSLVWRGITIDQASQKALCELSPTCVSQALATESTALPPVVRSPFMTGFTPPDLPINTETSIEQAREARELQADEQVVAHIRGVLSRLKSYKP
jgi:hypothetical protein